MKGLKKYLHREGRRDPRHAGCADLEFYVWDTMKKRPRTGRGQGCLTEVSLKGACLQTNQLRIGDYHLFLDDDPQGKTVLALEIPSPSGEKPWVIQTRVISYNKFPGQRKYQFDVRLQFVNLSANELRDLEQLIKSQSSEKSNVLPS